MAIQKVTRQVMKSGAVLQVGHAFGSHADSTTSTGFVDCPNMSVTLSGVRAGSKIIIQLDGVMLHGGGAGNFTYGQLIRDGATTNVLQSRGLTITSVSAYSPITMAGVVASETAGNHTYKFQWRVDAGNCQTYGETAMIVWEIAQ